MSVELSINQQKALHDILEIFRQIEDEGKNHRKPKGVKIRAKKLEMSVAILLGYEPVSDGFGYTWYSLPVGSRPEEVIQAITETASEAEQEPKQKQEPKPKRSYTLTVDIDGNAMTFESPGQLLSFMESNGIDQCGLYIGGINTVEIDRAIVQSMIRQGG